MRRTSALARAISEALAARNVTASPRRLEEWTGRGLGAAEDLPLEEQLEHYIALADVAGPGRAHDADRIALRLSARGFSCPRLRSALLHHFNIAEEPERPQLLDLSTGPEGVTGFAEVEGLARAIAQSVALVPQPMRRLVEELRRRTYDAAEQRGEPGHLAFHGVLVNALCLLLGGEVYDVTMLSTVAGGPPAGPDDLDFVNTHFRVTTWERGITRSCGSPTRPETRRTFLVDQDELLALERRQGRNADAERSERRRRPRGGAVGAGRDLPRRRPSDARRGPRGRGRRLSRRARP